MASPVTPGTDRALSITPGSRVLKSSLIDETIWKRLKEAGFDEESIKKRDKAALIAYIAKLEAEVCFKPLNFFSQIFFHGFLRLCLVVGAIGKRENISILKI